MLQSEDTPVVSDDLGEPYNCDNYGNWFRAFCVRHGLGRYVDENGKTRPLPRYNANGFPVDPEGRPYSRSNPRPKTSGHRYEGLKFHELRHSHITLEIGHGMDIKTVQMRAGHSSPSVTLDVYTHAFPANGRKAAGLFESVMREASETKDANASL